MERFYKKTNNIFTKSAATTDPAALRASAPTADQPLRTERTGQLREVLRRRGQRPRDDPTDFHSKQLKPRTA